MLRKSRLVAGAVAFFFVACLVVTAQEPKKDGDPKGDTKVEGKGKGKGGPGGGGGFGGGFGQRTKPGTVLASAIQDQLKLTEDQKKEIAELQKMVDEKLAKIMTDDQKKQFKIQDRPGGGFGGGGFGRQAVVAQVAQAGVPPRERQLVIEASVAVSNRDAASIVILLFRSNHVEADNPRSASGYTPHNSSLAFGCDKN